MVEDKEMEADLAARTLDRATSAMQTAKIACLPEIVKLLRTLSGKSGEISIMELAEVIQNDPVILTKVIGAANTLAYNPNAVPVTSVNQAIHVIGYERIRSLAMSLMLAEQASRSQSVEEQREIAAQALISGCLAQSIASRRYLLDKEQAFICGCLRTFGHVVMAACMFDEYKQAKDLAGRLPDDEAYRGIFGLTPLELGHQLLKAANLPEEILATLRALPLDAFAVLDTRPDEQMRALIDCSSRLAQLTCDPRITPDEFASRSIELARLYENALPNLAEEVSSLMQSATRQMDHIVSTFRLRTLPVRTLSRMRACRNAVDPDRPKPAAPAEATGVASSTVPLSAAPATAPPAVASAATRDPHPPGAAGSAPATGSAPSLPAGAGVGASLGVLTLPPYDWQGGLNTIAALMRAPGMTQEKLHRTLLEAVRAGLGAQDCLLFSARPLHAGFPLALGCGRLHERLRQLPAVGIQPRERTVFGVCLQRNENINIHHTHDAKITAYLPPWLKGSAELGAFVLLPLTDGTQAQGVVLVGWADACQITLPPECVRSIRTMIAFVCKARGRLAA